MSPPDFLQGLRLLLVEATARVEALAELDALSRAQRIVEQIPQEERRPLLDLVRGELEVCRMRREQCLWISGSRMYVNRRARIFARTAPEPDPHDALREATTQGTINSVRTIVDRLGPQPAPAPDIFAQTCAGLTQPEREQALALARHMLTALETLPPART